MDDVEPGKVRRGRAQFVWCLLTDSEAVWRIRPVTIMAVKPGPAQPIKLQHENAAWLHNKLFIHLPEPPRGPIMPSHLRQSRS